MRRRLTAFAIDALIAALAGVILFLLLTGGGVYRVGGVRVSLRSVDHPLLILSGLLLIRFALRSWGPFLANPKWQVRDVEQRAQAMLTGGARSLDAWPLRAARHALSAVMAFALLVKSALARLSPGFYSGDDVEIHEMTFSALYGYEWPVWELRSSVFPLVFVYPFQAAAAYVRLWRPVCRQGSCLYSRWRSPTGGIGAGLSRAFGRQSNSRSSGGSRLFPAAYANLRSRSRVAGGPCVPVARGAVRRVDRARRAHGRSSRVPRAARSSRLPRDPAASRIAISRLASAETVMLPTRRAPSAEPRALTAVCTGT